MRFTFGRPPDTIARISPVEAVTGFRSSRMPERRFSRYLILLCLVAATGEFCVRGPARAIRQGSFTDFSGMYVASRQWIAGADPYSSSQFKTVWLAAGGEPFLGNRGSQSNVRPAYPPSSLPVLAPFALFRWFTARGLFLFSSLALFPVLLWSVLRLEQVPWGSDEGLLICAFALALAPWHVAIAGQSITAQAIELAVIGCALRSPVGGGLLTGLALCLKPQLAAWFVLFEIAQKRWSRVCAACALFGLVTLVSLSRMPSGWLDSYRENLRYFFIVGGVNDFTTANAIRFDLLNLQVMLYYLLRIYRLANILPWLIVAWFVWAWWRRNYRSDLACLATIVLIGLLPVYQRTYNAGVVILVLPYALCRWPELRGKLLIAACSIFLIPGTAILEILHHRNWISEAVWNESWWLNLIVGPHATWAILGMIGILLLGAEEMRASASPPANCGEEGISPAVFPANSLRAVDDR
jgi:glycosyl transferase family 87